MNLLGGKVDTLMVSETKIDKSFPFGQNKINGCNSPFRLNRNSNGGGIILFVQQNIPAKLSASEIPPIEGLYVEIMQRKKQWLINCFYNPNKSMISQRMVA